MPELRSRPQRFTSRPDCLPEVKAQRTDKLVIAARSVLADMRDAEQDPAQTLEAKVKRAAAYSARKESARVWLRDNPGPHDPEEFRRDILPGLITVTVPRMMRATGLTSSYCWKIRRGERLPHPMYWNSLRNLLESGPWARS